jgi:hypothetical protein
VSKCGLPHKFLSALPGQRFSARAHRRTRASCAGTAIYMKTSNQKRMNALEKRVAKLEKAAALFEEHRQTWIEMSKSLKKLKQEMDRDTR